MRKAHGQFLVVFGVASLLVMGSAGVTSAAPVAFNHDINPPSTTSFDISWVDNSSGHDFVADRTNNAVDLINTSSDSFAGYIGQGVFAGNTGSRSSSGPNGVVTDSAGLVWAGDGNSSIKVLHATPGTGSAALIKSISTGGTKRADELSYDPKDGVILIANDLEGFLTFVNVASQSIAAQFYYGDNTVGKPATAAGVNTPGNGIEQSLWNPATGYFYQALPANSPSTVGRVDIFTPAGQLVATRQIAGCTNGPTGLALGVAQRALGACDNGGAVIQIDSGHVDTIVPNVGGADEIWFNPGDRTWYLGISDGASGALGVVTRDNGNHYSGTLMSGHAGHSVAASASNNHVYVPEKNGSGVAVYE